MSLRNLLLLSLAALGALAAFLLLDDASPTTVVDVEREVVRAAPEAEDRSADLADASADGLAVGRVDVLPETEGEATGVDHPWADLLAGVTGRIVEEDGSPVVAIRVELLEGDLGVLLDPEFTAMGHEGLTAGESKTDADGRFLIEGAMFNGLHAFSIDGGGGRSTIRVMEHGLEPGVLTDVGDIVLPRCGTVTGTVFDEDGEPVPGARVRIAPIPEIALQGTGILDLREKCMVAGADGGEALGVQLPDFLMANMARLPIPTTMTAEDGTFRLEGVPFTTVCGGVDKAGFVATIIPTFTMTQEEQSVGELDLEVGRTITGRVVDALGKPVAGAEVCAGASSPLAPVGILQPTQVTAEDGTFEVVGISELGTPMASARRSARESWVTAQAAGAAGGVEVVLSAAARAVIRVEDEEGEPVADARVKLRQEEGKSQAIPALALSMFNVRTTTPPPVVEEREPGVFVVEDLGLGDWVVRVETGVHAPAESKFKHEDEETECVVKLKPARVITASVVDAATGLPVENAYVRVAGQTDRLLGGFAADYSDAEGRAELGPLPLAGDKSLDVGMGMWSLEPILTVEHPAYGSEGKLLPKDSDSVTIELTPACTLSGVVTWGGGTPLEIYMVSLVRRPGGKGDEVGMGRDWGRVMSLMMSAPRTTLTNLTGEFRFGGLAAGSYEMVLSRRFLDSDPLEFIIKQQEPEVILTQRVEVGAGDENFVELTLEPDGEAPRAIIEGQVIVNGEGLAGATVKITQDEEVQELYTNSGGGFRSDPLSTQEWCNIEIEGEVELANGEVEVRRLYDEWKKPSVDRSQNEILVELDFGTVVIEVLDAATGAPVEGATVSVSGKGRRRGFGPRMELTASVMAEVPSGTDSNGQISVEVDRKGKQSLNVTHPDYEELRKSVNLDPSGPAPHATVRLTRSVPCRGRAVLPDGFLTGETPGNLFFRATEGGSREWVGIAENGDFSVNGLKPGTYRVQAFSGRNRTKSATFELGPQGNENLVLEFELRE